MDLGLFSDHMNEKDLHLYWEQYKEWKTKGFLKYNELGKLRDLYYDKYAAYGLFSLEIDLLRAIATFLFDANDSELKVGDPIYYVDVETGESEIEAGKVFSVQYKEGNIDSIGVDFADDFDEFMGDALGHCLFRSEREALDAINGKRKLE